jgi:hypothetical protein
MSSWVVTWLRPRLNKMSSWVVTWLRPRPNKMSSWVVTWLRPRLNKMSSWVVTWLGPWLNKMSSWVVTWLRPRLNKMSSWVVTWLRPRLNKMSSWVVTWLGPRLNKMSSWLRPRLNEINVPGLTICVREKEVRTSAKHLNRTTAVTSVLLESEANIEENHTTYSTTRQAVSPRRTKPFPRHTCVICLMLNGNATGFTKSTAICPSV